MWVKIFLINWIVNILAIEFLAIRKLQKIINVKEERDSKYAPFRRKDIKWMNRAWLYLTCHLSILKTSFAILTCVWCGFANFLITMGTDTTKPLTGIRYKLIRFTHIITSRVVLFCASSAWYIQTKRPKYCYKKYLGPEWKPDYDVKRCGTVIANHTSFLDSPINAMY
jgi:hypothetical protein